MNFAIATSLPFTLFQATGNFTQEKHAKKLHLLKTRPAASFSFAHHEKKAKENSGHTTASRPLPPNDTP
ncbi:hypothetical protein C4580_05950 [Candidatus Woesearchaeota archaeon]|nr:MAG: hypothetical protein C4580_05950 [Candidatus Woesearchaeota archaeon]